MKPHRDGNDAMLEQELERLMSVEPSAEFQARIRTRVARETVATSGGVLAGWLGLPTMAFVVACIVLAMVVVRWNRPIATSNPQARVTPAVRDVQPPTTVGQAESAQPTARLKSDPAPTPSTVRADSTPSTVRLKSDTTVPPTVPAPYDPFSDILVSASETRALRQVEMLLAGKPLKEEEARRAEIVRDDLSTPLKAGMTELAIEPIAIEPIQIAAIKGDAE